MFAVCVSLFRACVSESDAREAKTRADKLEHELKSKTGKEVKAAQAQAGEQHKHTPAHRGCRLAVWHHMNA